MERAVRLPAEPASSIFILQSCGHSFYLFLHPNSEREISIRRLSAVAAVSYAGDVPAGWNIQNERGDWVHVLPVFGETTQ